MFANVFEPVAFIKTNLKIIQKNHFHLTMSKNKIRKGVFVVCLPYYY